MSASPLQTPVVATFGPRKLLWVLPCIVAAPSALRIGFALSSPSYRELFPPLGIAYAFALVPVWVLARLLSSLWRAPTLTVQQDALVVRASGATRKVPWTEIRDWSISNGGRLRLDVAGERLQVQGVTVRDRQSLLTTLSKHIGRGPQLELGLTSEPARRADAAVGLCMIVVLALLMREQWTYFALAFAGAAAFLALVAALFRRPRAVWTQSWTLAPLMFWAITTPWMSLRPHPSPLDATAVALTAGTFLAIAMLALGILPRVRREKPT